MFHNHRKIYNLSRHLLEVGIKGLKVQMIWEKKIPLLCDDVPILNHFTNPELD